MDIEEVTVAFLRATQAVKLIVGADASARIYPDNAPQDIGDQDHLLYELISKRRVGHLGGQTDMYFAKYQWACCSRKMERAKELAKAVVHANGGAAGGMELDGYSGEMMGDVKVWIAVFEDERSEIVPSAPGEESPRWKKRILDLMVCYNE